MSSRRHVEFHISRMVGRPIRAVAAAGVVRMERQRIMLLDREGLEAEAQH